MKKIHHCILTKICDLQYSTEPTLVLWLFWYSCPHPADLQGQGSLGCLQRSNIHYQSIKEVLNTSYDVNWRFWLQVVFFTSLCYWPNYCYIKLLLWLLCSLKFDIFKGDLSKNNSSITYTKLRNKGRDKSLIRVDFTCTILIASFLCLRVH